MRCIYLFESGSTKTTLLVAPADLEPNRWSSGDYTETSLPGYNPNRPDTSFLDQLEKLSIESNDVVCFYGSGLGSQENKDQLRAYFQSKFQVEASVFDDLQGAARALFGNGNGLVAIMGTGGIAAYCENGAVSDRMGGYGYLIDDFGGGLELGKHIVSAWLNKQLPEKLNSELETALGSNPQAFISDFYGNTNPDQLKRLGNLAKLIAPYQNVLEVRQLLELYFDFFFQKSIVPLSRRHDQRELKILGSLAVAFQEIIQNTARKYELELTKVMRYPALTLLAYHLAEKNKTTEYENGI